VVGLVVVFGTLVLAPGVLTAGALAAVASTDPLGCPCPQAHMSSEHDSAQASPAICPCRFGALVRGVRIASPA
jgi:hypothetical protein